MKTMGERCAPAADRASCQGILLPEHLALVREAGRPSSWPREAVLLRQGDPADRAILIERGQVKITAESGSGYTSLLAVRGVGELIGELSALDGRSRSATVTAMTAVQGYVVSASVFRRLLMGNGALAMAVLNAVVARLRDSDHRRAEYGAYGASARTSAVLLDLAEGYGVAVSGSPRGRSIAVTQQELAGAVGTSRESVVRALRELHHEGLVETSRGKVVVLDLAQLEHWVRR